MTPLRDVVLIKADPHQSKTNAGLLVSEAWKTLPLSGEVLRVGPDVKTVKPGDRVVFMRYATIILDNDERLAKEAHILCLAS